MSAIEERRQRAREAAYDEFGHLAPMPTEGLSIAIETATRVKITDEAIAEAYPWLLPSAYELARPRLAHALRTLGFEVEV